MEDYGAKMAASANIAPGLHNPPRYHPQAGVAVNSAQQLPALAEANQRLEQLIGLLQQNTQRMSSLRDRLIGPVPSKEDRGEHPHVSGLTQGLGLRLQVLQDIAHNQMSIMEDLERVG